MPEESVADGARELEHLTERASEHGRTGRGGRWVDARRRNHSALAAIGGAVNAGHDRRRIDIMPRQHLADRPALLPVIVAEEVERERDGRGRARRKEHAVVITLDDEPHPRFDGPAAP